MTSSPYPPGFNDWPEDPKSTYFAEEAAKCREQTAKPNGTGRAALSPAAVSLSCASEIMPQPIAGDGRIGSRSGRCTSSPVSPASVNPQSP